MGLFISIINHTVGWLRHENEYPMDRVAEWLRENDLESYIQTFEEYGWDKLPVLLEMTENDIEMCIQKPGHKAKFKRALRYLKSELDNSLVASQTDIHKESDRETMKVATTEAARISAVSSLNEVKADAEKPITETNSLERQFHSAVDSDSTNNANVQFDSESDQEAFSGDKEAVTMAIKGIKDSVSTSSNDLSIENKVDAEQPLVAAIENQFSDIINDSNTRSDDEERIQAEPGEVCDHAVLVSKRDVICTEIANIKTS